MQANQHESNVRGDDAPSAGRAHWVVLLGLAGAVLLADQIAKATVRTRLPYGDTTRLGGLLELHHTRNAGLLGGTLQGAAVPVGC